MEKQPFCKWHPSCNEAVTRYCPTCGHGSCDKHMRIYFFPFKIFSDGTCEFCHHIQKHHYPFQITKNNKALKDCVCNKEK